VRVLLTRPHPDTERTAGALRALGHDVLAMPLLRIEPVDAELGEGPWGAVLVTSANACRAIAAHKRIAELTGLPLFAVGRRTAQAARVAGFSQVCSADGEVGDLARLVSGTLADTAAPLIYLAGAERAGDLEGALAAAGFAVRTRVVYRAVAQTALSGPARAALANGEIDAVLHFSRRTAEAFLAAAAAAGLTARSLEIRHYCLSRQVAAALAAAGAADLRIAAEPHERALLEMLVA
jgi:uroporphyrinogen-III synthase